MGQPPLTRYDPGQIRADFDRIAALDDGHPGDNARQYSYLLAHVPAGARTALDLGCGTGSLTRLLARRCTRVVGLDLSPRMLEVARSRSIGFENIDYRQGDLLEEPLTLASYDVVASVATLHHFPLEVGLGRVASLVRPGGVLLVLDLFEPTGITWLTDNGLSWAFSRWLERGRPRRAEVSAAWRDHGARERYPRIPDVREVARRITPGAMIRKHLLWRWTLDWKCPRE